MKIYLWICVLINGGIGVLSLLAPLNFLGTVNIGVTAPSGIIELRAMYGGLQVGLALFVTWCLQDIKRWDSGVILMVLILLGLGITRLINWLVAMPEGFTHPMLFAIEFSGAAIGFYVRQVEMKSRHQEGGHTPGTDA
ncbi:MAG: hypothetical protein CMH56_14315 [Myxococcales bacterium]|nr:hypothetical protein [Myxococcales bacterium]|tara:strand:+ start:8511 stop:8924 length:414 start_codon:yes stop_codon:yes gene_type:complete